LAGHLRLSGARCRVILSKKGKVQMSFGLSSREYLSVLEDAHEEYRANMLSVRHLMVCCMFANQLPEIIVSEYAARDARKLRGHTTLAAYRGYMLGLCPETGIVRDLCDFARHGPKLDRKNVLVDRAGVPKPAELDSATFLMGVFDYQEIEKIVITLNDGSERFAEFVIGKVVLHWNRIFATDRL
jgi:hypothetical protein